MKTQTMKALIAQAVKLDDQSVTKTNVDFEKRTIPAGKTTGRFIEYIELGKQPQKPYKGKERKPVDMVRLTFEFTSPKNLYEIGEGDDKKTVADRMSLTVSKLTGDKAKFKKIFNKLRYGREDITHFAQMLGEGFIFGIRHNTVEKDGASKTYSNLTNESNEFMIDAPAIIDPLTETVTPVQVPEALSNERLFLWDLPTKETWDALFIDGTRTVKDAKGQEKEVSKNWIQNTILGALNITGSALEAMLEAAGLNLLPEETAVEEVEEEAAEEEVAEAPAPKQVVATAAKVTKSAPATTTKAATTAKVASPSKAAPVNPLAALGLA